MRRTVLVLTLAAATAAAIPAHAGPKPKPKPKPITKSFTFTDATPDPSGNAQSADHCAGVLPREAFYVFAAPAPGKLKIAQSGFVGDWSLSMYDAKGKLLTNADVNPPSEFETAVVTVKKAAKISVLPCNIGGTPQAQIKLTFTYS